MAVTPYMLNTAAFVGVRVAHGDFIPTGTCFLISVFEKHTLLTFVYVVTCRHLADRNGVCLRIGRRDKLPKIIDMPADDWYFPENRRIDLAVAPFDMTLWEEDGELAIAPVGYPGAVWGDPATAKNYFLCPGADLAIPSLFVPHPGERANIPIMRLATIAAMPGEPLRFASPAHSSYLIESRSLGGSSGSPVFVNLRPYDAAVPYVKIDEDGAAQVQLLLLGMLTGAHSGDYADDFATPDQIAATADSQFNAGISVVTPISVVMDFILGGPMADDRARSIAADKKRVGSRPTSVNAIRDGAPQQNVPWQFGSSRPDPPKEGA